MTLARNQPTPEGRAAGAELARFVDVAAAELRGHGIDPPALCKSCAFRLGTSPNSCLSTMGDALKCVFEGHQFNCHEVADENGELTIPCGGWLTLRATTPEDSRPVMMPWPFSDEVGEEAQRP